LQEKPFRILTMLLERPGEVVTREDVRKQLWPEGTFVDFDEGLDTAMRKLRYALGDSAQNPTFIQTIPRRGYRFIAPVGNGAFADVPTTAPAATRSPAPSSRSRAEAPGRRYLLAFVSIALVTVVALGTFAWKWRSRNLNVRNVQMAKLTDSGRISSVAISPDGRRVVYAQHYGLEGTEESLWLRDIATGTDVQILPAGTGFHGLTFSPSGDDVYFVRSDEKDPFFKYLYSMPAAGGPARKLITDIDSPVSFSPDGRRFVYERCIPPHNDIEVKVSNADGSGDHLLTTIHDGSGLLFQPGPNWSPDGRTIAVPVLITNQHQHWALDIVSATDGSIREMYSSREEIGRAVWLTGGAGLLFPQRSLGALGFQLWTSSFPEGRVQPVTRDLSAYGNGLDMTKDGNTFAVTLRTTVSHIWIAPATDLSQTQQVTSDALAMLQVAEAFDGKLLARAADDTLWLMHTDGSQRTRFTDVLSAPAFQVSDDLTTCGRFVIFSVAQENSQALIRVDRDGLHPTVLVKGNLWGPACSADGAFIFYYAAEQPEKIWKVQVEGGAPQYVADVLGDQHAGRLDNSPDGRFLAYPYTQYGRVPSEGWKVAVIPTVGGPPVRQLTVPGGIGGVRWSPDSKGLQYVLTHNGVTNLWQQPLTGGKPKQLTQFTSGVILDFNWSLDRTRLLLTRGAVNSDVVLLKDLF
jgi:DNA-binding winged helix-turn-helix (wHTH) protein/Tol biopolymer transport system component